MPTIYQIIIVTLLASFIVLASNISEIRYKLRDKQYSIANFKIAKMLDCEFCYSFWVSTTVALILSIVTFDISWVITPVLAVPLIRLIL